MGGTYKLSSSIKINNTNTFDKEVVYKAYKNQEVTFTTAEEISLASATKVNDSELLDRLFDQSARDKIYVIDMSGYSNKILAQALPGTYSGFVANLYKEFYNKRNTDPYPYKEKVTEPYPYRGTTTCAFYMDDELMTNARYPNDGYLTKNEFYIAHFGAAPVSWGSDTPAEDLVPESERNILDGFQLKCASGDLNSRVRNWQTANQAILFGFFTYDWASQAVPVKAVNDLTITSLYPCYYGLGENKVPSARRFYIYDLFEEIDVAGEYFLDRTPGAEKLYFYSETIPDPAKTIKMVVNDSSVIEMKNAKNVTIDGIEFKDAMSFAVYGQINTQNENIKIRNCDIRNLSGGAIYLEGKNIIVENCVIKNTDGGIFIKGGNVATLERADNIVRNNDISNYAVITKTYMPAIEVTGVGNTVTHNEIYDNDHYAITFNGCYNEISYNDIHDVLKDTDDAGAIYGGAIWVNRGNEVKYNYIHDIKRKSGLIRNSTSVGIYFDDQYSGANVYGNVLANIEGLGMFFNGGYGNTAQNNIFIKCETPYRLNSRFSLQYYKDLGQSDEEAEVSFKHQFYRQTNNLNNHIAKVESADAEDIWIANFGDFWTQATTDPDSFMITDDNVYTHNVVIDCTNEASFHEDAVNTTKTPNYYAVSTDFGNYANGDYTIKQSALNKFAGFTSIDFSSIGIQK